MVVAEEVGSEERMEEGERCCMFASVGSGCWEVYSRDRRVMGEGRFSVLVLVVDERRVIGEGRCCCCCCSVCEAVMREAGRVFVVSMVLLVSMVRRRWKRAEAARSMREGG